MEPLIQFLTTTESSTAIYMTIRALIRLGDARAIDTILRFIAHDDHHVRESVSEAMLAFGHPVKTKSEEGNLA